MNPSDSHKIFADPDPTTLSAEDSASLAVPSSSHTSLKLPTTWGHYKLLRRLGFGGMGVVYEAIDLVRGQKVAIKTLQKLSPSSLYRLKNEFRSVANIHHPNLVSLYELVSFSQQWFIAMEFIEGQRFSSYVRQPESQVDVSAGDDVELLSQTWEEIPTEIEIDARPSAHPIASEVEIHRLREALSQLVHGIEALHRAGKLHRDIKSSNVLVTASGRVVILDFGLTLDTLHKHVDLTIEESLLGTPAYMAPEQAAGGMATPASDWYAVGVMLFETIAGQLPFTGNALQLLTDKQHKQAPSLQTLAPQAPADLIALSMDLLQRDPKKRPTGQQILARLGVSTTSHMQASYDSIHSPSPQTQPGYFVGREDLLKSLESAFQTASLGAPVIVYVQGNSGIGKTALIEHFLGQLQERHEAVILSGRCYESESVPYKAFDSLIDALTRYLRSLSKLEAAALMPRDIHELVRVFPVLERVPAVADVPQRTFNVPDQQELRRRAFRGLKELLARISDRHSLVLHLGDIQWGDEDSALLLSEILEPPDPPSLLLIASYRSGKRDSSPMLKKLSQLTKHTRHDIRYLHVGPLSMEQARELALARLGRRDDTAQAQARRIASESEGSPLFVEELVRYVTQKQQGELFTRKKTEEEHFTPLEISLEQAILARLHQLPSSARHLLDILAVVGQPISQDLLLAAVQLSEYIHHSINLLRATHFVRIYGSHETYLIEYYHDRIRETILSQIDQTSLQSHHRTIATTFEANHCTDLELLSYHYQGAGNREKAAHYAIAAAENAVAALAFNRAAELYQQALANYDGPEGKRRELLVQQADAFVYAGRCGEAAPIYLHAAQNAPLDLTLDLHRRAAEQFLVSGRIDEGMSIVRPLLQQIGLQYPQTPARALATMYSSTTYLSLRGIGFRDHLSEAIHPDQRSRVDICWSVGKGLGFVDPIRGYCFSLKSLILALQIGDPTRIARSLASVGMSMMSRGTHHTVQRGSKLIKEAERIAHLYNEPYLLGHTKIIAGIGRLTLGHWQPALELIDAGYQILQDHCTGVTWESSAAQMAAMRALMSMGKIHELAVRSRAWQRQANDMGNLNGEVWAGLFSAFTKIAADDATGAREQLSIALDRWSHEGFHFQHMLALILNVYCDLYQGRPMIAWQELSQAWSAVEASHILRWQFLRIFSLQARGISAVAFAAESPQRSHRLLEAAENDAKTLSQDADQRPDANAAASLIRAGIANILGKRDEVDQALTHAIEGFETANMMLHAACARYRKGEWIGGSEGEQMVRQNYTWMQDQGIREPKRWVQMYAPGFASPQRIL